MNENIDLTEILKGCEGMTFWCNLIGDVKLISLSTFTSNYHIKICGKDKYGDLVSFMLTKEGLYSTTFPNGECVLFPSKYQRDWSKFERPIPVDTPMMCSNDKISWTLRFYKNCTSNKIHFVFINGSNSNNDIGDVHFPYMIPFDKFDPKNIEESLKYNIQK